MTCHFADWEAVQSFNIILANNKLDHCTPYWNRGFLLEKAARQWETNRSVPERFLVSALIIPTVYVTQMYRHLDAHTLTHIHMASGLFSVLDSHSQLGKTILIWSWNRVSVCMFPLHIPFLLLTKVKTFRYAIIFSMSV